MKFRKGLNRRSFVTRVTGGAMLTGSPLGYLATDAFAFQTSGCSDSDPHDPGGNGRNCTPTGPYTGCSDSDPTDAAYHGRRCTPTTNRPCTDRDPVDPGGRGRGCGGGSQPPPPPPPPSPPTDTTGGYRGNTTYTGCSDSDSGTYYDRSSYGRSCAQRGTGNQTYTGITDADRGENFDRAGYGRGTTPGTRPGGGGNLPQLSASIECDNGVPLSIQIGALPSQNCHIVISNYIRNTAAPVVVTLPQALDTFGNHANGIQVVGAGQENVFNWDSGPRRWGLFVYSCFRPNVGANCYGNTTAPGTWSIPIVVSQEGALPTTVMLTGSAFR